MNAVLIALSWIIKVFLKKPLIDVLFLAFRLENFWQRPSACKHCFQLAYNKKYTQNLQNKNTNFVNDKT